jgi:hypothetical protein
MQIRGHTLLCLQGFRGEGYSPGFIDNLAKIHRQLEQQPDTLLEVIDAPDAVCGACPQPRDAGCTLNGEQSEDQMRAQDQDVLRRLGLKAGTSLRWREILHRIRASVTGTDLPAICGQCRWLPLGYCKEGIDQLRAEGPAADSAATRLL